MSGPGEEVRIVAVLDTTDVDNGVKRTEKAAREMRQVWETTMNLDFPREKLEEDAKAGFETVRSEIEKTKSFWDGFLGKLLLRDAIYSTIRGLGDAIKAAEGNLETLAGVKPDNLSLWQEFTHWIGTAASMLVTLSPGFNRAAVGLAEANVGAVNAQNIQDRELERFKTDPSRLATPTATIESQLQDAIERRADARMENARAHVSAAAGGDAGMARDADVEFSKQDKFLSRQESFFREMLSIAKERDRKEESSEKSEGNKKSEAGMRAAKSVEEANIFMEGEIRKDAAKAEVARERKEKRDAAHARKVQEHLDSAEIASDEITKRHAGIDLKATEHSIGHERATSAVMIHGAMFGRNDANAALVQHAAQQVSLLRSIDAEIKHLRKEKSDMTLL